MPNYLVQAFNTLAGEYIHVRINENVFHRLRKWKCNCASRYFPVKSEFHYQILKGGHIQKYNKNSKELITILIYNHDKYT